MKTFSISLATLLFSPGMKFSSIAFFLGCALGFISIGLLGALLLLIVSPALQMMPLGFSDINDLHGDWVWPAMIGSGLLWPTSFLVAGILNVSLVNRNYSFWLRATIYAIVLWLYDFVIWSLILAVNLPNN